MSVGFIVHLLRGGRLSFVVLIDCAVAPNARAVPMQDIVVLPEFLVAANEATA